VLIDAAQAEIEIALLLARRGRLARVDHLRQERFELGKQLVLAAPEQRIEQVPLESAERLERVGGEKQLAPAAEKSGRQDHFADHETRRRTERERRGECEQIDFTRAAELAQHLVGAHAYGIEIATEIEYRLLLAERVELVVAGAEEALGQKAAEDFDETALQIERRAGKEQLGRFAAIYRIKRFTEISKADDVRAQGFVRMGQKAQGPSRKGEAAAGPRQIAHARRLGSFARSRAVDYRFHVRRLSFFLSADAPAKNSSVTPASTVPRGRVCLAYQASRPASMCPR
jgi:hypothetical protein